jgi:hypothetical protein
MRAPDLRRSIQVGSDISMQSVQKSTIFAIPLIILLCAVASSVDAVAYLLCD